MSNIRQEKVSSLIKRELGPIFQREGGTWCPGGMITVTIVRVTPDLRVAKVYLSIFNADDPQKVLQTVKDSTSKIRGIIGKTLGKILRSTPDFQFFLDDSLDYAEEIDTLLKS